MITRTRGDIDGGFALVEVLAALILATVLASAVGGLFAFGSQLRDRTQESFRLEKTLMDLQLSVAAQLQRMRYGDDRTKLTVLDEGFILSEASAVATPLPPTHVVLHLPSDDGSPASELEVGSEGSPLKSSINLTGFETTQFQFLILTGADTRWVAAEQIQQQEIVAVQLVLEAKARRFPIVLWSSSLRRF